MKANIATVMNMAPIEYIFNRDMIPVPIQIQKGM